MCPTPSSAPAIEAGSPLRVCLNEALLKRDQEEAPPNTATVPAETAAAPVEVEPFKELRSGAKLTIELTATIANGSEAGSISR